MSIKDINMSARPACDNDCEMLGYTDEYIITKHDFSEERHISIKPISDINDEFLAFNHDIQECQVICGRQWLFAMIG